MPHDALRNELQGELLEPGNQAYDTARIVWNGMIDRRPGAIARCRNAADVTACVNAARESGLLAAIRAGGHNVAGYAVCDGGLMIDLSGMNAVRLDPQLDRVYVEGGATWGDVDAATVPFGRATPGGLVSATGVAGLTLSGGIGWLRGTHGLCVDNLIAADVVTADGRLIRASERENGDLLWALKGGGGNFGVVVNFEFRLHPVASELMFRAPAYPEEQANEVLRGWRDFMVSAPDEVSGIAEFSTIPSDPAYPEFAWGKRVLSLATVYDGPAADGKHATEPLLKLGDPLVDFSDRMDYRTLQKLYDGLFPKGRDRCYWKSTYRGRRPQLPDGRETAALPPRPPPVGRFARDGRRRVPMEGRLRRSAPAPLARLDDEVIGDIVAGVAKRPSEMTYASVWNFGGAVQRVAADATAFGDRSMPYMLSIDGVWSRPADDAANIAWVRNFWRDMQRHSTGRLYLNFPGHGEDDDLVRNAFGAQAYTRLQEIKRKYDPANLFRMNQNIQPA